MKSKQCYDSGECKNYFYDKSISNSPWQSSDPYNELNFATFQEHLDTVCIDVNGYVCSTN